MNQDSLNARTKLLEALKAYELRVLSENEETGILVLEKDYSIEIEANGIYKLKSAGKVIAPFADLEELCQFIKYYG